MDLQVFVGVALFTAAAGYGMVPWLARVGSRQNVSEDAPAAHASKQGVPTMGGAIVLLGLLTGLCTVSLIRGFAVAGLLAGLTLAFGLIGFLDDILSIRRGKNLGLKAREKLALQVIVTIAFIAIAARTGHLGTWRFGMDLGWFAYVWTFVLMVMFNNAVNLADGADGLAAGMAAPLALGLAMGANSEVSLFMLALAGALAGFLYHNAPPASVFLGDTGSLAIGAALAGGAVLGGHDARLLVGGLVFWAVTASVIIQVAVFKWRRLRHGIEYARAHRVFRHSPLHHHFEECGVPETKVVARFVLVSVAAVALSLGSEFLTGG